MKHCIMTGASGFVGKYLLREYIRMGYSVTAVIRSENSKAIIEGYLTEDEKQYTEYVMSDLQYIEVNSFKPYDFDAWIHMGWGGVNRDGINNDSIQRANYLAELRCIDIAARLKCRLFCDLGSRAECDDTSELIVEKIYDNPLSKYGYYKQKAYIDAKKLCDNLEMKYIHYRLFSVIGLGDHPWSVVMTSCKNFINNVGMNYGSCQQMWNFMDVRDVVRCISCINEKVVSKGQCGGIINIASKNSRRLRDYILEIYSISQSNAPISFSDVKGFDSYPSVEKMLNILGDCEEIPFDDTIREILDFVSGGKDGPQNRK